MRSDGNEGRCGAAEWWEAGPRWGQGGSGRGVRREALSGGGLHRLGTYVGWRYLAGGGSRDGEVAGVRVSVRDGWYRGAMGGNGMELHVCEEEI